MSCRWTCAGVGGATSDAPTDADALAVYRELARGRREAEFRWFARSRGVAGENVERMWKATLAEVDSGQARSSASTHRG